MNQLENKTKSSRNGNGSQIAGVETCADDHVGTDHSQMEHSPMEQGQADHSQAKHFHAEQPLSDPHFSLRSLRAEAEIYAISRTLQHTAWNPHRAAHLLSISYLALLSNI